MAESSSFAECVQQLHNEFRAYDKTVDLVSCWEFYFTKAEPVPSNTLCFDRFPRLTPHPENGSTKKTPDFAALLSDQYGLVGEIKEGFPRDEKSFLTHLSKLKKYDCPLAFRSGSHNETAIPSTHDILLMVPYRDAQEIVNRIAQKLSEGAIQFERSLVVFEWVYDSDRDEYVFRKVAGQPRDFNDSAVPQEARLSAHFSQRGATLKISPDKIKTIKATWQFCNDAPPDIFTLVFLWTKIFYHLLDPTQRENWRRRDPNKQLPLDLTIGELTREIERRYPLRWGHWSDWCRSALDTLVAAGLARRFDKDRYTVGFRNLVRELGEPGHARVAKDVHRIHEYERILATYICRGKTSASGKAIPTEVQGKLFPTTKPSAS